MYFVVFATHREGMGQERLRLRDGFAAYLHDHPDHPDVIVHHGGPTLGDDGETVNGLLLAVEAPSLEAAGAFVALSVTSTVTRFAVPVMADRVGSKGVMAVCFSLQTLPIVLLFFSTEAWHFYLFSVLFGIGFGGEMSAFPIINRQYYGSAPIGTTYGWQMMGAGVGMAAGSLTGGALRDWTGSFDATMGLSLALSLVGVLSIVVLPTTRRHQLPDWERELPPEAQTQASPAQPADAQPTQTQPAAGD